MSPQSTKTADRNGVGLGVAITGIAARFPGADSLDEFKEKLYGGVDMVTNDGRRWRPGLYGTPERSGKINILDRFDNQFFNISPKQVQVMDPMVRMLLEVSYEAMFDAGVNPSKLRGSRTGVYVGLSSSASESNEYYLRVPSEIDGLSGPGCCRSVFANRISLFFDFKGPSFPVDATCASSLLCLDLAVQAIMTGRCDSAIVAGTNVCLKPEDTVMLYKLGVLSVDGSCKAFDSRANGYVRSEAIVALFLQKATEKIYRNYGTVLGAISQNDGYRELGLLSPSENDQMKMLNELYGGANVDVKSLTYVEAHGSGTQIGDDFELNAIANALCKGRTTPLLVGSIKTNCGHSEPAAGFLSIFKVLLAAQEHLLPSNLHFQTPNPRIPALLDGRVKVVTENTAWDGGVVGVSAYGIGGNNSHAIISLNTNFKQEMDLNQTPTDLVLFSGRTRLGVQASLSKLASGKRDVEVFALLREFFKYSVPQHHFRGYALIGQSTIPEVFEFRQKAPPPVCFVFSGMGTQWKGMGKDLMAIKPFRKSIHKSAEILGSVGFDLHRLFSGEVEVDGPLESFLGIVSIQIGLIDVLAAIGVVPDKFIGHSVGELSCAYADGSLTLEQTLLAAHARAQAILSAKLPPGAMASVGLTWEEAKVKCPADIFPACHNAADNVTVSGSPGSIADFVAELSSVGIYARVVDSAGIAFHSSYICPAEKELKLALEKLIPTPAVRGDRWISTSLSKESCNSDVGKYSSAAYHANNLVSPVLFHEALKMIPDGAVVLEIAPHALLQPILKRSPNKTLTHIPLLNKNSTNQGEFFLRALGKLYGVGVDFDAGKLYAPVAFPVTMETPMLFPLVAWDHSTSWNVPSFEPKLETSPHVSLEDFSLDDILEEALARLKGRKGGEKGKKGVQGVPNKETTKTEAPAQVTPSPKLGPLLQSLAKTLSIQEFENIWKEMTLAELGMDSMLGVELKGLLKTSYGMDVGMEKILRLTLSALVELEA